MDPEVLDKLGLRDGTARAASNAEECLAFTSNMLTQRAIRISPVILDYPHACVGVIDSTLENRVASKNDSARHCRMLLRWGQVERKG